MRTVLPPRHGDTARAPQDRPVPVSPRTPAPVVRPLLYGVRIPRQAPFPALGASAADTTSAADAAPALGPHSIAAAGLALADEHGAEGVTVRAVARRLGVSPMALYHHVEGKAGLVALVVEQAVTEVPLPDPDGRDWRRQLLDLARWMRQRSLDHPAISLLRRQHEVWAPGINAIGERWLSVWLASGLEPHAAFRAASASAMAVLGVTEEQGRPPVGAPVDATLAATPNLEAFVAADHDPAAEFDLLVEALIDGLHRRLGGG